MKSLVSTWAKKVSVVMGCNVFCYYCYHLDERFYFLEGNVLVR